MEKMNSKKIICNSCGGEFEDTLPACPFCESFHYKGAEAEYFTNDIYGEDYAAMVRSYHENIGEGFEGNAEMKEYYGVAKYFEAASLYKVYLETGDTARAERERNRMDAAYEEMGEWNIVKPDIHAKLGLAQD